jgi:hypothetical protein
MFGDGHGHGSVADPANGIGNLGLNNPVVGDGVRSVNGALDGNGNGVGLRVVSGNRSGNSNRSFDELLNRNGNIKSTKVLYGNGGVRVMSPLVRNGHRNRSLNRHSHMIFNVAIVSSFIWEDLLMFPEALNRNWDGLFKDVHAWSYKGGGHSVSNGMAIITSIHDSIGSI